ncbi:MAG: AMP-binding protein [Acidobacteria bacterium]|nr:AMP-binding protein [Acidobacteriota bacterium]
MSHYILQTRIYESFQKNSNRIAIEHNCRAISYSQLEEHVLLVADKIKTGAIKKGTFVGIYLPDPLDFAAALLGVIFSGCVFMPLDTTLPPKRVETMLQMTGTRALISDHKAYRQLLNQSPALENHFEKIILLDELKSNDQEALNRVKTQIGSWEYQPEDPLYIYFTSGSTGSPKAIIGKNKSLRHFIDWESETFHIHGEHKFSQFMTVGFDAYLRDLLTPLFNGGTLCIPENRDILMDGGKLNRWIEKKRIHLIHLVPSLFRQINAGLAGQQEIPAPRFRDLKYILLSGEKINTHELKNWYDLIGNNVQLVNLYGPSETTLVKTFYFIKEEDVKKGRIPIGKPMKGAQVILFDKDKAKLIANSMVV